MLHVDNAIGKDRVNETVHIRENAVKGDAIAQFKLAELYRTGSDGIQSYKNAVYWYTLAANQGVTEAQYNLGVMYANGLGVSQNYEKAFEWYQIAAEKNFLEAQGNLGVLYSKGKGVGKDYEKAMLWLNKAAVSGLITAQTNLALLYDETNKKELAEKWYRIAADQGEKVAQYHLGRLYYEGVVIKKDYNKAAFWYDRSASQNFTKAQSALSVFYYEGLGGIPVNKCKAIELLKKAATHGDPVAQHNLALIYSVGVKELPRDNEQAYAWYSAAYANGLNESVQYKSEIAKKLTPYEFERANILSKEYIEKYKN
ncbi:TPA: sel1 repeat family protein [Salmonella enterica]|nr:sel1 repeat family protein [Salmonella enterica]